MTYSVEHIYADTTESSNIVTHDGVSRAQYAASGELRFIRHPGLLVVIVQALYATQLRGDDTSQNHSHPNISLPTIHKIPMTTRIFSPDGHEFTANHVTLADLERFRNLRESSQGSWRYETSGVSAPILIDNEDGWIRRGEATVRIAIEETVPSRSGGLLVSSLGGSALKQIFSFDLFRVGQFIAAVKLPNGALSPTAKLQLRDPAGTVVASSIHGSLIFPVSLRTIDKSRDVSGNVRPWSLVYETTDPALGESVTATVIQTTRLPVSTLQGRIDNLLGPNGNKLSIYGENKEGYALARLKILDEFTAETFDMHNLLDDVLTKNPQDAGGDTLKLYKDIVELQKDIPELHKDIAYSVAHRKEDLGFDLTLDVGAMSITILKLTVGPSKHIHPTMPAITVDIAVHGELSVDLADFSLASVWVKDNWLTLEIGLTLDHTGSLTLQSWITNDPLDMDVRWEAAIALSVMTVGISNIGIDGLKAYLKHEVHDKIINGLRNIVEKAILSAPRIMAMFLGEELTLRSLRMEGADIVIDYVAPIEPDPRPSRFYRGIIGRSVSQVGPDLWDVHPHSLGDTWAADNLTRNIDNIVVVMMENRSFDHVLGYRQLIGDAIGNHGYWDLIEFLSGKEFPINLLKYSGITPNAAGLKTKFPAQVGHRLKDVTQQLAETLQTDFGLTVNSPKGFVDDFAGRVTGGLVKEDVLGIYDGDDLAFYRFLAENYAYCERYFSSYPGPTLPNRMYSLGGDLQYDRVGEVILDNNSGDSLTLSRALNIFDLLTRKGVSWRVYESFPSITMLRMFARYVGDQTNIFRIANLKPDIAAGNLPSVTFIDPAMHHAPQNDDHPVADMLQGQIFLKTIYDELRSNEPLWLRTMLIITYDEHGGFYDHVVPPIAEVRSLPITSTTSWVGGQESFKPPMMIPYGVRVPAFVVSPWVAAGKGPNITLDHCSILKTILARFCGREKPFLSDRVHASLSFNSYLSQTEPRLHQIPASPILPSLGGRRYPERDTIVGRPVSRNALRNGDVDFHDLTAMLARMIGRP